MKAIVLAAFEQFLMRGFDGAIMDRIASDAGVSRATLYARFPTKVLLFRAVVEDHYKRWADRPREPLDAVDWRERLRLQAARIAYQFGSQWRMDHNRLMQLGGDNFPEHSKRLYGGYEIAVDHVADEIARGTAGEGAPARDPRAVAVILVTALFGWRQVEEQVREIPEAETEAFARGLVDRLLAGRAGW